MAVPAVSVSQLRWTTGRLADVPAVASLAQVAFEPFYRETWTERQMTDLLLGSESWLDIGLLPDLGPVAFALCRKVMDEVELLLCASHPACRQQGLGAKIVARVLRECQARNARRLFLEVRAGNTAATALYRKAGFEECGRRRQYYRTAAGDRIDAITMAMAV